ncbi:MAG TPA: SLC13 family permease [Vicinamibacterales bacterium]|nr:SLC13 family permease [Vicinamibacterales bacterium]
MNPAVLSLLALIVALALSMLSRINVGWLALTFAWIIGVYSAGMRPDAVMAGFPVALFLTLAGVTLLFAVADANRTLEALAHRAVDLARGSAHAVPILLFVAACVISSIGPGAISTVALLAPIGIAMGRRAGVAPFLMALAITNGANAGNLSPFSAVGIIANGAMAKGGLEHHEARVWFANFAAHLLVAAVAYVWLARRPTAGPATVGPADAVTMLNRSQKLTLTLIGGWIVGVLGFNLHIGLSAFAAAAVLFAVNAADDAGTVRNIPWGIIMMVCGVSVLIGVLEKTGGMDLFTALLARLASPGSVNGVIAFVTGAISTYSSTSGVVMPAFLPTAVPLVERLGGGDPLAVALSINVGSSLVDVSPLSTLGALCVAAVSDPREARDLFRKLMMWGVSMTIVGAILCQLFAGALARVAMP